MLSAIQHKALHCLAKRTVVKLNLSSPVMEAFESLGLWHICLRCIICAQMINCSCKEPHPGLQHKLDDVLEEHGIQHLKEHNLLAFL